MRPFETALLKAENWIFACKLLILLNERENEKLWFGLDEISHSFCSVLLSPTCTDVKEYLFFCIFINWALEDYFTAYVECLMLYIKFFLSPRVKKNLKMLLFVWIFMNCCAFALVQRESWVN